MRKAILVLGMLAVGCTGGQPGAETDGDASGISHTQTSGANPDRNAYFGDMHIHTKNSFDAYIFNVRTTPDDAYEFGQGGTIKHPSGYDMKLSGPALDFMAVTDHASYLGILPTMHDPDSPMSKLPIAQNLYSTEPERITAAFQLVGGSIRDGKPIPEIYNQEVIGSTWAKTVASADTHYKPGKFTTFAAYEYTATDSRQRREDGFGGGNLHRNVFFRGAAPKMPFSTLNSTNPEDLWTWMDEQRAKGLESLSIPHNGNVSDSQMFKLEMFNGGAFTKEYAEKRMRNEPLVEITQVKGTSETNPSLSPNDEWADFEIYEVLLGSTTQGDTKYSYARKALKDGLELADKNQFNPFRFGFIGSSDTHLAGAGFTEKEHYSKIGIVDGLPKSRGSVPPNDAKTWDGVEMSANAKNWFSKWSASGLAGVWAEENTREAIFDAMRRKETFATSGTRIKVRFFASFNFSEDMLTDAELVSKAYKTGVPMGGDLEASGEAPTFIAWAVRDPLAAPLQRVQIVKVWSENGVGQEKVFDIACSDGLKPDPSTNRCADNGAEVDLSDCSISTDKGASEIKTAWRDPEFKEGLRAAYYVRVIENPTCRWSTWDALKAGVQPNPKLPATLQERAWTSPIWLLPKGS